MCAYDIHVWVYMLCDCVRVAGMCTHDIHVTWMCRCVGVFGVCVRVASVCVGKCVC